MDHGFIGTASRHSLWLIRGVDNVKMKRGDINGEYLDTPLEALNTPQRENKKQRGPKR